MWGWGKMYTGLLTFPIFKYIINFYKGISIGIKTLTSQTKILSLERDLK